MTPAEMLADAIVEACDAGRRPTECRLKGLQDAATRVLVEILRRPEDTKEDVARRHIRALRAALDRARERDMNGGLMAKEGRR